MNIYPAIMCGGSGTRLWPLSRRLLPKQFIALVNQTSMLQDTLARLPQGCQQPIFICNEAHRFTVAEQVNSVQRQGAILLEPEGKNTAPAVALAAFKAIAEDEDALLLVLAADHVITNEQAFKEAINQAKTAALADKLVTFGIVPTKPETGYGYIKHGPINEGVAHVAEFVEKPDLATAQEYLATKQYLWNSGMFMFKASRYLAELQQYRPEIYQACRSAMDNCSADLDFIRPDKVAFERCPDESIDYAVMEHTQQAVVVPLDAGWSDVGSYSALWEVSQQDQNGNVCKGDVLTHQTANSYLHSENKLIATVGVENLVVIDTPDAVLVAEKSQVQEVKHIVETLKRDERCEVDHPSTSLPSLGQLRFD